VKNAFRKRKMTMPVNERKFPFIVQIAVPDGGFGYKLDGINAWHHYSRNKQRQGKRQTIGGQEYRRWCFESLECAEMFRRRFGGEIVPVIVRRRNPSASDIVVADVETSLN
jgi:hypothetical protein